MTSIARAFWWDSWVQRIRARGVDCRMDANGSHCRELPRSEPKGQGHHHCKFLQARGVIASFTRGTESFLWFKVSDCGWGTFENNPLSLNHINRNRVNIGTWKVWFWNAPHLHGGCVCVKGRWYYDSHCTMSLLSLFVTHSSVWAFWLGIVGPTDLLKVPMLQLESPNLSIPIEKSLTHRISWSYACISKCRRSLRSCAARGHWTKPISHFFRSMIFRFSEQRMTPFRLASEIRRPHAHTGIGCWLLMNSLKQSRDVLLNSRHKRTMVRRNSMAPAGVQMLHCFHIRFIWVVQFSWSDLGLHFARFNIWQRIKMQERTHSHQYWSWYMQCQKCPSHPKWSHREVWMGRCSGAHVSNRWRKGQRVNIRDQFIPSRCEIHTSVIRAVVVGVSRKWNRRKNGQLLLYPEA